MHRSKYEAWGVALLTFANSEPVLEFVDEEGHFVSATPVSKAIPVYERYQRDHRIVVSGSGRTFATREEADAFARWVLEQRSAL